MNRNSLSHQFARRSRAHRSHMAARPIAPVVGPLPTPETLQARIAARRAATPWARVAALAQRLWARGAGRA